MGCSRDNSSDLIHSVVLYQSLTPTELQKTSRCSLTNGCNIDATTINTSTNMRNTYMNRSGGRLVRDSQPPDPQCHTYTVNTHAKSEKTCNQKNMEASKAYVRYAVIVYLEWKMLHTQKPAKSLHLSPAPATPTLEREGENTCNL